MAKLRGQVNIILECKRYQMLYYWCRKGFARLNAEIYSANSIKGEVKPSLDFRTNLSNNCFQVLLQLKDIITF